MSKQVPVGAVVNEAFNFGLKRWGTVLRVFWLPTLVTVILLVAYFAAAFKMEAAAGASPADWRELLRLPLPAAIAGAVALMLAVSVLMSGALATMFRLIALGEQPKGFFHLRFDGPAVRTFLAGLILALINLAILATAAAIVQITTGKSVIDGLISMFDIFQESVRSSSQQMSQSDTRALMEAAAPITSAYLYAFLPMLYVGIKFAPFMAGTAAENRIWLFGSFRMTFGHWWSIFFSYVLFTIAFILLAVVIQLAFGALEFLAKYFTARGGAAAALGAVMSIALFVVSVIYQAFALGAQSAMQAVIYRRIKTGA